MRALCICLFLLAAILPRSPQLVGQEPPRTELSLSARARRPDSRIRFSVEESRTVIDVTSEFGIDRGQIRRTASKWPQPIVIRAHLRGLESFKVTSGEVAVEWSASPAAEGSRVTLWQGQCEAEICQDDPYHTKARFVADTNAASAGGYFEIPLPKKLFEGNPRAITVQWVDFYRN